MGVARVIKKRIRSTKNIKQITKAMQAVSAVKMRKSEEVARRARPYAHAALLMLKNLTVGVGEHVIHSPFLFSKNNTKKTCLAVITSDKGLAGSFNTNVLRSADKFLNKSSQGVDVVAIGKKARDYYTRRGVKLLKDFTANGDFVDISETKHISDFIKELFLNGIYKEVVVIYTNFISALKQEVITRQLLPFTVESLEEIVAGIAPLKGKFSVWEPGSQNLGARLPKDGGEYLFEPTPEQVLSELLPTLLDIEVYQAVLEANASEHSSRMVAMKNASENAGELIDSLTILYNKSRQAQITKELTEITAGTEALTVN